MEDKIKQNRRDFLRKGAQFGLVATAGGVMLTQYFSEPANAATNEDMIELLTTDGEVVLVVDGVKDNKPGQANPLFVPGNTVIIKTNHDEYLFYAHFKQHSILVKQGQQVKQGDVLGLCGNSGNSTEPHIHFHIQNVENSINATGIKAFFEEIRVNGAIQNDYSLVKSDQVIEL